jgi:hypothetical protein
MYLFFHFIELLYSPPVNLAFTSNCAYFYYNVRHDIGLLHAANSNPLLVPVLVATSSMQYLSFLGKREKWEKGIKRKRNGRKGDNKGILLSST